MFTSVAELSKALEAEGDVVLTDGAINLLPSPATSD
jgi:hypothetical protein